MKLLLFVGVILLILNSCKKDYNNQQCPDGKEIKLDSFSKQFFFSYGKWRFIDTSNLVNDSICLTFSFTGQSYAFYSGRNCPPYTYDGFNSNFTVSYPSKKNFTLFGQFNSLSITLNNSQYAATCVFQGKVGSIKIINAINQTSELENFYSTLSIRGITYKNVYQMWYYPDLNGFRRIWWCPSVGFIKYEMKDTSANGTKTFELINYSSILSK